MLETSKIRREFLDRFSVVRRRDRGCEWACECGGGGYREGRGE